MKKIIITFLFIFMLSIQIMPIQAVEYDSVVLNQDELEMLKSSESSRVIKIYNGLYVHGFAEEKTIAELICKPYTIEEEFIISKDSTTTNLDFKVKRNGTIEDLLMINAGELFYQYATQPEILFADQNFSDLEIKNIYCLDGTPSYDGVYIYFVTSEGDYVYYQECLGAETEYLFPVKDFCDFSKAIYEERVLKKDEDRGISASEVYDMTPYEIGRADNPNAFSWTWIVVGGVSVAVIALVTVTVIHLKKRKISVE